MVMVNGLTSSSEEEEEEVESQDKFEAVPPSNFTSSNISPLPPCFFSSVNAIAVGG